MSTIHNKFKAEYVTTDNAWWVITDDEDGIKIARIPHFLENTEGIAKGLALAMTNSDLALTDLV